MPRAANAPILVVLLAASAAASAGETPALPGPAPRPRAGATVGFGRRIANATCAGCHEEIAAEWRGSLHRGAWVDPVFRKAFDVEPLPFCRSCHAPEGDPARDPAATEAAAQDGVGCTTCHVEGERVVGPRGRAGSPSSHPVFGDPRLATARACAGCHQFDFPAGAHQLVREPMQDTLREHARAILDGAPAPECQSCHMPGVTGEGGARHRSHAFAVISDPAMIRRAARVSAVRLDDARVAVTIAPGVVGHSFPTGDMFRRLEVRAFAGAGAGRIEAEPVELARVFRDAPRDGEDGAPSLMRTEGADERVPPPGAGVSPTVILTLPRGGSGNSIHWQVVYQRMSTPMAEAFGVRQVLDEIVVAEGEVPAAVPSQTEVARKGEQP